MTDREIYPNPPVVLVAVELRHPVGEPLDAPAQVKLKRLMADRAPVHKTATFVDVQAVVGTDAQLSHEQAPRFLSRDRTLAVSFRREAITVETTAYRHWEDLREVVELAITARHQVAPLAGIERLGLRYIDEIRVPTDNAEQSTSWAEWVDASLLPPAGHDLVPSLRSTQWQGVTLFENGPERFVGLRHGCAVGYAVNPDGELARNQPPPGPYFLIDIDSFWSPAEVPELDIQKILSAANELHTPIRALFESLITERLRREVLRHV